MRNNILNFLSQLGVDVSVPIPPFKCPLCGGRLNLFTHTLLQIWFFHCFNCNFLGAPDALGAACAALPDKKDIPGASKKQPFYRERHTPDMAQAERIEKYLKENNISQSSRCVRSLMATMSKCGLTTALNEQDLSEVVLSPRSEENENLPGPAGETIPGKTASYAFLGTMEGVLTSLFTWTHLENLAIRRTRALTLPGHEYSPGLASVFGERNALDFPVCFLLPSPHHVMHLNSTMRREYGHLFPGVYLTAPVVPKTMRKFSRICLVLSKERPMPYNRLMQLYLGAAAAGVVDSLSVYRLDSRTGEIEPRRWKNMMIDPPAQTLAAELAKGACTNPNNVGILAHSFATSTSPHRRGLLDRLYAELPKKEADRVRAALEVQLYD